MRLKKIIAAVIAFAFIISSGCAGGRAVRDDARFDAKHVQTVLLSQLKEWKGTPYRMGGLSKAGIDCSGFVFITFKKKFGMDIPRSTSALAGYGRKVRRDHLRPGDLVFFKTGFMQRHVGIYFGNGQFIHASTSSGVMKSGMAEEYWSRHYWQARRVLEL